MHVSPAQVSPAATSDGLMVLLGSLMAATRALSFSRLTSCGGSCLPGPTGPCLGLEGEIMVLPDGQRGTGPSSSSSGGLWRPASSEAPASPVPLGGKRNWVGVRGCWEAELGARSCGRAAVLSGAGRCRALGTVVGACRAVRSTTLHLAPPPAKCAAQPQQHQPSALLAEPRAREFARAGWQSARAPERHNATTPAKRQRSAAAAPCH